MTVLDHTAEPFDTAVHVYLGLPLDRSLVDHGTAFDIAGAGKANHVNLLSESDYAHQLAQDQWSVHAS